MENYKYVVEEFFKRWPDKVRERCYLIDWPEAYLHRVCHRIDGPARIVYNSQGVAVKVVYCIHGWIVYLGVYIQKIKKAKDINQKFCEVLESLMQSEHHSGIGYLLAYHFEKQLDPKLFKSTLAALELMA